MAERRRRRLNPLPRKLKGLLVVLVVAPPLTWAAAHSWEWARHRPAAGHYDRGIALYRSGEFTAAMEAWQAAIRAEPGWTAPYLQQADAFRATGRSDLAIGKLLEALQASPRGLHLTCRIAEEYRLAEDSLEAGLWAERAVSAEPACPKAHVVHAATHRTSVEEAHMHLETAVRLAPNEPEPLLELGRLYAEAGNLAKADEALQRVFALGKPGAQAHYLMGMVLARRATDAPGRAKAEQHLREAIRLDPENYNPYAELGLLLERQRRWKEAAAEFERARALNPHSPAIIFHLATVYQRDNDPRAAALRREHQRLQDDTRRWTGLRKKLQERPDDAELALETAEVAMRLGARVIALNLVRSVLQQSPNHPRALKLQARITSPTERKPQPP